jgi:hypothetical protein
MFCEEGYSKTPFSFSLLLVYLPALRCGSDYSFSKLKKKGVKSMKILLAVSLNLIKQFNLETCQSDSLSSSSFELNLVGADSK